MTKDEMKDKISMALKDLVLKQGFEIICKNLAELEKEKCELLGIIQDKDKVIQELKKENAELDCQMNRNKFCYSCANATDRCFRNEIGCPCEKYKSYKGLNKQLNKANDDGDIIGHDMCEAKAKALAAEMQEKEPDASWEAMNGDDE